MEYRKIVSLVENVDAELGGNSLSDRFEKTLLRFKWPFKRIIVGHGLKNRLS